MRTRDKGRVDAGEMLILGDTARQKWTRAFVVDASSTVTGFVLPATLTSGNNSACSWDTMLHPLVSSARRRSCHDHPRSRRSRFITLFQVVAVSSRFAKRSLVSASERLVKTPGWA